MPIMPRGGLFIRVTLLLLALCGTLLPGCDDLITEERTVTLVDTTLGQACLTCHTDSDDSKIVQPKGQWEHSAHASIDLLEAGVFIDSNSYNTASCGPECHSGNGFVQLINTGNPGVQSTPSVINCFTCHTPHTGNYGTWTLDSLRGHENEMDLAGDTTKYRGGRSNMCVHCHQGFDRPALTADTVNITPLFGPHWSVQGNVLASSGGFILDTGVVPNSHASVNTQGGCLKCHFGQGVGYTFGEHTFRLEDSLGTQMVANCNVAGCHVSGSGPTKVVTDFYDFDRLDTLSVLADSLELLLRARGVLTADPSGTEYLLLDSVPRDLARILYNYLLFHQDGSRGVHNPKYFEKLLRGSLAAWDSLPSPAFRENLHSLNE